MQMFVAGQWIDKPEKIEVFNPYDGSLIETVPKADTADVEQALAAQGLRFTDCYAGSTVCAPSRCVLMTGRHTGHCRVRGNARVPLEPGDITVAEVLKDAGYRTGLIGKWGLGEPGTTGHPNRQGFDYFFGYLNQGHAHNYYPDYLWRNEQKVLYENVVAKGVATKKVTYSQDLFAEEALKFVEQHKTRPFFLYLAFTAPHANNEAGDAGMEVPELGQYARADWPENQKAHAAMISRMDRDLGRLMEKLKALGIDDDTLVMFSSDNGPHREGGNDPEFNRSSGPLRGIKRSLHDGGIRVPFIARWPGHIAAGGTSDLPCYFADVLPTLAELAGGEMSKDIDGLSLVPTLLGEAKAGRPQPRHEFLYWEFHEGGSKQAVRMGNWKGVRNKLNAPLELYLLTTDIGEANNVATEHPEEVAKMEAYLKTARTDSKEWPLKQTGATANLGPAGK